MIKSCRPFNLHGRKRLEALASIKAGPGDSSAEDSEFQDEVPLQKPAVLLLHRMMLLLHYHIPPCSFLSGRHSDTPHHPCDAHQWYIQQSFNAVLWAMPNFQSSERPLAPASKKDFLSRKARKTRKICRVAASTDGMASSLNRSWEIFLTTNHTKRHENFGFMGFQPSVHFPLRQTHLAFLSERFSVIV